MDPTVVKQTDLYEQTKRLLSNFKKSPKDRLTVSYIETRKEILVNYYDDFMSQHKLIIHLLDKPAAYQQLYDDFIDIFMEMSTLCKEKIRELTRTSTVSQVEGHQEIGLTQAVAKLPPIKLPTFSGDYGEWVSFRDLFKSLVHENNSISKVNKCQYLKSSLQGEAEGLVKHISVSESNYDVVWNTLNKRFDNKRSIVNAYLNKLCNQRKLVSETARGIKDLLDTTSECLISLQNIGIPANHWDDIIVFMVLSKLDSESHKLFEQTLMDSAALPTWSQLSDFLEHRFRTLEMLKGKEQVRPKETYTSKNQAQTKKVFAAQVEQNSTTTKRTCTYCKDDHFIFNCKKFRSLNVENRRSFVQTNTLCFKCLREGHYAYQCLQSTTCNTCARKHNTLLHLNTMSSTRSQDNVHTEPQESQIGSQEERKLNTFMARNQESHLSSQEDNTSDQERKMQHQESKIQNQESMIRNQESKTVKEEVKKPFSMVSKQPIMTLNHNINSCPVLLATALIDVYSEGEVFTLRALIDQGSQASLITESACQRLKLRVNSIHGHISGINSNTTTTKGSVVLKVKSRCDVNYAIDVQLYVLKTLTSVLPGQRHTIDWPQLFELPLADPTFQKPDRIDMILGAEVYARILQEGMIKSDSDALIAQKTHLGWLVSGQPSPNFRYYNEVQVNHTKLEVDELLERFWKLEDIDKDARHRPLTKEESKCEDYFQTTSNREMDGRYTVRLPFQCHPPDIGESRAAALKRLNAVENKCKRNPKLREGYNAFMKDYIDKGHMEAIPSSESNKRKVCYLPHHAVISPQHLTTKLRVVFDGSAKTGNGKSLNDNLLIGPPLQNDIRNIILRWRRHKVVLVADIRQMYRQILVDERDVDYQRIVWRFSQTQPVKDYRLLTVTYGTSCAPYIAIRTLKKLVEDEREYFPEEVLDIVEEDFYMDDLLTGCSSVKEAQSLKTGVIKLLCKGGFQLHKWTSNSETLREDEVENSRKILGVNWNMNQDVFILKLDIPEQRNLTPTKRSILGDIAKIYDPAGWLSPIVIVAKIILQRLWLAKLDWDERLPEDIATEYLKYQEELFEMTPIKLNRWIEQTINDNEDQYEELHGFSDASTSAYSAVVYYRSISPTGVKITLLEAKTKVSPVKQVSVPRLELCGAVLLAKLLHQARKSLNVPLLRTYAWTDSTIVLAWLQRHPNYWSTFVANCVTEITNRIDKQHWHHVGSKDNPADVASRGIAPIDLPSHALWWHGPSWLLQEPRVWTSRSLDDIPSTTLECKLSINVMNLDEVRGNANSMNELFARYSSLSKLIRVVAFMLRFIYNCKERSSKYNTSYLTTQELRHSLDVCIKLSQSINFRDEIKILQNDNKISLKGKNRIVNLNPYMDENNVLRVGGRISKSYLPETVKHPIILSNDIFAQLIVEDAHHKTLHGGAQLMISYLRTTYWIIKIKILVKKCIRDCMICYRQTARPMDQLMGNLPLPRVTPNRPFLISGVDFAGPVILKMSKGRGGKTQKAYISLFICTSVKAIHLELVTSLDTDGFIAAFRRFTARRGHCKQLLSDCGTNFVGASKQLNVMADQSKLDLPVDMIEILSNDGTEWCFNPPSAAHMGGLWESGVKSTKYHLKRVLGDVTLTYEEYATVLCQIEACLNSRPISLDTSSFDPSEPTALTPGHFLIGEPPIMVPDQRLEKDSFTYNNRWIYLQQKVQEFWRRWNLEYLTNIQKRTKWKTLKHTIKEGNIVLVKDERLPPSKWALAKVIEVHPGTDGIIRVVSLKYKSSTIKRPIHKLCLLPQQD